MAKSVDLRVAAAKHYLESMDTYAQTGKIFGASASSVQRWVCQYVGTGSVENKPLNRSFKKIDPEKLKQYVKDHPDDTQEEMAVAFGCCNQAISKALKRHGITRKKKRNGTKNRIRNR